MRQETEKKRSRKSTQQSNDKIDSLWYFERMDMFNRTMQGRNDLEQLMKDVLDLLLEVFNCDRAWLVYPCDPNALTWQVPMERTRPEYPGVLPIGVELPLDAVAAEIYRTLLATPGPVKFGAGEKHAVPMEIATAFQVQSFIAMAFYPKLGKSWSFGLHQCSYARTWTPNEERLFQEIGHRLSDTLSSLLSFRNLEESEAQIKKLIDVSPVAMVVSSGEDERVISINDKFIEMFGYTFEDMPDVEHWWTLAYPDESYGGTIKAQWKEKVQKAIKDKSQIEPMEAQVTCKDGSIRYVEFQFSSIGHRHLVTFVDLTARKLAEIALKEREHHSQSLLRLSRKFESANTYKEVLNAARNEVASVIGYKNLWAYLFDEEKLSAHVLFAEGPLQEKVLFSDETMILNIKGDRMLEEIVETKEIVVVEDARTDPRTNKEIVEFMGNCTIVNVPILLFDKHLGSVGMGTFGDEGLRMPTEIEQQYLTALASHMAVTLDRIHSFNQRKQMEQELIAREKEYRLLVENIPDLIVRYDKTLRRVYVNPAWEKASGLSAAEVVNVHMNEIPKVSNPVNKEYMEKLQQALTEEIPQAIEFTWVNAFGEKLFLEYVIVPEYDQHGNISGVLSVGRNITERKQMEEALQASEAELRTLINTMTDIIFVGNSEGRFLKIVDTNPSLLYKPSQELLGKTLHEVFPKDLADFFLKNLRQALETQTSVDFEYSLLLGNKTMWFYATISPMIGDQTLMVAKDITDLKQAEENLRKSEQKFRALAENIPNVVFQCKNDSRYTFVYLNNAIEELTGYPKEEFIENGLSFFDLYHPDDLPTIPTPEKNNKNGINRKPYHITYRIRHRSGTWRWVDEWGTGVVNSMGIVEYLEGIMVDITDRIQMEDKLLKTNVLLERIFATTESLIAYLDTDFNFIRVNRAYANSSEGLDPDYFDGKNHFALYPNPENEAIFRKVVETGEPYSTYAKPFEYAGHPERGITYWNWSLLPVKDEGGQVSGLVLNLVDVTARERAYIELRQNEEQLRLQGTALEAAANGFMITDRIGQIIWVNPAFTRLTGYSLEEVVGQNPKIMKSGKQDAEFYKKIWNTILAGNIWHGELVNRRKDGSLYTEEMTIASLRGEDREITHFIAIKQDVSERKRHEREREAIINVSAALRQATSRAEILTTILDQMSALFDAGGTFIALPHTGTGDVIIEMGRGPIGEKFNGLKIPHGMGVSGWVIMNKRPYLNNSANIDPIFYRPDLLEDYHCVASVPLIAHEKSIGALWIARRNYISEQDLQLLNAVADIAANAIHRVTLHEQTEQQLHHLLALHQIDLAITTNFDLNITLNIILTNVQTELEVDAACILLLNTSTGMLEYGAGLGFRTDNIKRSFVKIGDGISGRAALEQHTVSCPDLEQAGGQFSRTSLLAEEEFSSHFATPLLILGQVKGVLEVFHRTPIDPDREWLDYLETLATQITIAIENATLLKNLQKTNTELTHAYDATIEGWSRALDLRDRETEGHTQRVTEMSLELADRMGMSEAEKADLRRGALLHDIGKMGVPDSILHKPGGLTESEWEIMRQHPIFAYQMLSPISYLKRAVEISYCHHERWDGTGYPHGLKGEEIPLAARVFAIVDVFDALTSDRPYRKAWSPEEAYRYIEAHAGTHFDPQIVKVFLATRKK